MMLIQSGKYEGRETQYVLLRMPDWANWMIANHPANPICRQFSRHVTALDAKPFQRPCRFCGKPAVLATAYRSNTDLEFWCGSCDPYGGGATPGKLTVIRTYRDAVMHVESTCSGSRTDIRAITKALAEAKGAPSRIGNPQAVAFLP